MTSSTNPMMGDELSAPLNSADTHAARRVRTGVRVLLMVVAGVAAFALVGWAFDIPRFRSVLSGAADMKANTAVALLLASVSLFLRTRAEQSRQQHPARLAALAVVIIGAITASEYLFDWSAGIDELLFQDTNANNAYPGRMSPYSSIGLMAIGLALVLPRRSAMRPVAFAAASLTAFIGTTSMLGASWNTSELVKEQFLPPVAMMTAVSFVLLSLGAMLVDLKAFGSARAEAASIRGHVEKKVLVGFIFALVLLALGGGITYRIQLDFATTAERLVEAQQMRAELGQTYGLIADAESAQRSYLLSGDTKYRTQYFGLIARIDTTLTRLKRRSARDPTRLAMLQSLERLLVSRVDTLSRHLEVYETAGIDAARRTILSYDGVATMESIRTLIGTISDSEQASSHERTLEFERDRSYTLIALLITLTVAGATLFILFGSIVRDIRERARIAHALHVAQQEADNANHAKSQFLASMSHEIRTPMNGVIGMLEVLQQTSLMGQQREMVNLIRDSADSLLVIIDDILDFSKIEAGRLELERVPLSVAAAVERTCGLLNRLAERKGTTLTVFCDPAIPPLLYGDLTRLQQILINLTNNAIKFSGGLDRPGRVSVRAELAEAGPGRVVVAFHITDNGIGIDESTRGRIFTSFMQADASTTRRYGGTGLGLAISKQLAILMGGTIDVESVPDEVSVFTVRLPFDVVHTPPSEIGTGDVLEGLPCAVIGPHAGYADDLAAYLSSAGATVGRLNDTGAALRWTHERAVSLAVWVVEVNDDMRVVDEIVPATRASSDTAVHLVLVILGRGRKPTAEAEGLVLIDGNALKRDALVKAVAVAAGRARADVEPTITPTRAPRRQPATREDAIRNGRLILVAEDNEMNQQVIRAQLHMLGYAVDLTSNGREALEHWRTGNYAMLLADLHMPEMDGYDLTLAIRLAEDGRARTPIIALTANALQGEAERCREMGMDDYLTKPATLATLATAMEKWLPSTDAQAATAAPEAPPLDVRALEALIGTDPQLVRHFLREFRNSSLHLAAELGAACREQRPQAAADAAHKMKSSARSVGANELAEICAAIEVAGKARQVEETAALLPRFEAAFSAVDSHLRSTLEEEARVDAFQR